MSPCSKEYNRVEKKKPYSLGLSIIPENSSTNKVDTKKKDSCNLDLLIVPSREKRDSPVNRVGQVGI